MMRKYISVYRLLPLAVLVVASTGCASTAATLGPNRQLLKERTEPPALGLLAETEDLAVTLETVITPGGPGSWYKDAKWDEYVLTFENRSEEPVRVTSLEVVDQRGVLVSSETTMDALTARTDTLLAEYKKVGIGAVGVVAASQYVIGIAAAAAAPVALVAAPAYLLWRKRVTRKDFERTGEEFVARRLPERLSLASGGRATGSIFFPLVAGPSELVVGYEANGEQDQLSISLSALAEGSAVAP